MKSIRALLWDVDGTLLDFLASERAGIRKTFEVFGLGPCTDAMLAVYDPINAKHWQKLERGECTKRETMVNRFIEFFAQYGIETDAEAFNDEYQRRLPDTILFHPHGWEVLTVLSHVYRQYCITNGNLPVQRRKLKESGMDQVFDGVFISDDVGCEKPSIAYFRHVLDAIGCAPAECMVIGDSLTSDIRGANNMGIPCIWFNPTHQPIREPLHADFIIEDLKEVATILGCPLSETDDSANRA